MASSIKTLAQAFPSAATLTTLYTVPAATSTVCSTLVVCNQSAIQTSFRVSVRVAALADTAKQYLYYDAVILGNATFTATIGLTLAATDIVSCYATLGTVSFSLFGVEES